MAESHSTDVAMMRTIEAAVDQVCAMLEVVRAQRDELLKAAEDLLRHGEDPLAESRLRSAIATATAAVQAEAVIRATNESQIVDVPGHCDLCGQEKDHTTLSEICDDCFTHVETTRS